MFVSFVKYFMESGAIAVRRVKKAEQKRVAKGTGATILSSPANMDGEESFEASDLIEAAELVQERVCNDELIFNSSDVTSSSSSVAPRPTRPRTSSSAA